MKMGKLYTKKLCQLLQTQRGLLINITEEPRNTHTLSRFKGIFKKKIDGLEYQKKNELLCFEEEDAVVKEIAEFVKEIEVLLINDEIITRTINYRKNLKLKVPDAIIAATANVRELILVTAER